MQVIRHEYSSITLGSKSLKADAQQAIHLLKNMKKEHAPHILDRNKAWLSNEPIRGRRYAFGCMRWLRSGEGIGWLAAGTSLSSFIGILGVIGSDSLLRNSSENFTQHIVVFV